MRLASWSATGVGRTTLPVALAALSKGGLAARDLLNVKG
jgi:hypothetical protein